MKKIKNIYLALLWAVIILFFSSVSGDKLNQLPKINIPHLDKIIHFGMYFIFSLLLASGFKQLHKGFIYRYALINSLVLSIIYGLILELLQKFVFYNRSLEYYDLIANTFGSIAGIISYLFIKKTRFIY